MYSYGARTTSKTSNLNSAGYNPTGPLTTGASALSEGSGSATFTVGEAISVSPSRRPTPVGSMPYSAGSTQVTSRTAATLTAAAVVFTRVCIDGVATRSGAPVLRCFSLIGQPQSSRSVGTLPAGIRH